MIKLIKYERARSPSFLCINPFILPDQRPVGGNVRITVPLARLPVAIAALLYMRAVHILLVVASPAVVVIYSIWRSIVDILMDGIIEGAYIN